MNFQLFKKLSQVMTVAIAVAITSLTVTGGGPGGPGGGGDSDDHNQYIQYDEATSEYRLTLDGTEIKRVSQADVERSLPTVLCAECQELLQYALERLDNCPFQEHKTTCENCPVHCYRPEMRERIRAVMRYAGPRMLFRHPLLALLHLWDRARGAPPFDRT